MGGTSNIEKEQDSEAQQAHGTVTDDTDVTNTGQTVQLQPEEESTHNTSDRVDSSAANIGNSEKSTITDTENATSRNRQHSDSSAEQSEGDSSAHRQRRIPHVWTPSPSTVHRRRSYSTDSSKAWKRRRPRTVDTAQQTKDSLEYDQIERMTGGSTSIQNELPKNAEDSTPQEENVHEQRRWLFIIR